MFSFSLCPRRKLFFCSSVGIVIISLVGDHYLSKWDKLCDLFSHVIMARVISKMIVDNIVHAVIAGWCWLNVWLLQLEEEWSKVKLCQMALCATIGSVIDFDHFIEAGSLSLEDALNLPNRPFAHNTSLILILTVAIFLMVYTIPNCRKSSFTRDLPAMFFTACLSHQFRDACRRGLWLAPFGSILLPYKLFVFGIPLLPVVVVTSRRLSVFVWERSFRSRTRGRMAVSLA